MVTQVQETDQTPKKQKYKKRDNLREFLFSAHNQNNQSSNQSSIKTQIQDSINSSKQHNKSQQHEIGYSYSTNQIHTLDQSKNLNDSYISNINNNNQSVNQYLSFLKDSTLSKKKQQNKKTRAQLQEEINDRKEEIYLNLNLMKTIHPKPIDKFQSELFGEGANKQYYNHYKNLQKALDENKIYSQEKSTFTKVLNKMEKRNMPPSKIGLVKETGQPQKLQLNYMKFGDKYIDVMRSGLKRINNFKEFELSNNRITSKSSQKLMEMIGSKQFVEKINLSQNKIGSIGCSHLAASISHVSCKLIYLNLEENFLGNTSVIQLLKSMSESKNRTIKYLNLSNNFLTDEIALELISTLEKSIVEELYLSWNNLKQSFGKTLFSYLAQDQTLRVLDLSNNQLSQNLQSQPQNQFTPNFCTFLEQNKDLVHLDISFNLISYKDSQLIAESLKHNKTIYGLHYYGNAGYVDTRGFLIPELVSESLQSSQTNKKIDGVKKCKKQFIVHKDEEDVRDSCWICEGWQEKKFKWTEKESGEQASDSLFIHFSFENYKLNYFGAGAKIYTRMVPPGNLFYFFSNDSDEFFPANDHQLIEQQTSLKKISRYDDEIVQVNLQQLNKFFNKNQGGEDIIDKYYNSIYETKPRTTDPIYVPSQKKKTKKQKWTFPNSIFAKWRPDDAELVNLCFEYDWDCSKVSKIVKDPDQLKILKEFFRERYKLIKDVYKHYSAMNPIGDIWSIQNAPFMELIMWCQIMDQKITPSLINIKWTAVISGAKNQSFQSIVELFENNEKKKEIFSIENIQVDRRDFNISQQFEELFQLQKKSSLTNIIQSFIDSARSKNKSIIKNNDNSSESQSDNSIDENYKDELIDTVIVPQKQITSMPNLINNIKTAVQNKQFAQRRNSNILQLREQFLKHQRPFIDPADSKMMLNPNKKISNQITQKHLNFLQTTQIDTQALLTGKNPRNPERGINRYQMMEAITRIAEEKYMYRYFQTKNFFEAVMLLWQEHLQNTFNSPQYDNHIWRKERYWNKDCDYVLQYYKRILDHVYKRFSVKKVKPGQQPFMSLEEFNQIINLSRLYELKWFGTNLYQTAYSNAMQTQIDELGSDRIFQMNFVEFLEALARIAEEASMPPAPGLYENQNLTYEKCKTLPLCQKIEGLILQLLNTCCDLNFKQSCPKIEKSYFWKDPDESDDEQDD